MKATYQIIVGPVLTGKLPKALQTLYDFNLPILAIEQIKVDGGKTKITRATITVEMVSSIQSLYMQDISIRNIANRVGCSPATVGRVINRTGRYSEMGK